MALTPEKKVKNAIIKQLKLLGDSVYYFFPATGGYGRSGVPDIVGCFNGKFWAIECKAVRTPRLLYRTENLTPYVTRVVKRG